MAEQQNISYSQEPEFDQPQELVSPQQQDNGVVVGLPGQAAIGLPQPTLPQPDAAPAQPSQSTVDKRTFKIDYSGLSKLLGQTEDGIRASIASGQEDWIRREAASKIDYNNAMVKHDKILQAYTTKGAALTPDEVLRTLDPFNPRNGAADPAEVIERSYATSYVSAANTAASYMQDNFLDKARGEIPDQVQGTEDKTTDLTTIREYVHTKAENLQDEIEKQGYIGWTANQLQLLFQPYSEYKLRGLMKEVGILDGGVLLGNNLDKTIDAIYSSPNPKAEIDRILEGMTSNPTLGLMFLQSVLGMATSDRYLNNIYTVLAPLDISTGIGVTKKLLTKMDLFNKTQRGYRDVAKSLEIEHPTQATIAETVGNTDRAAALRVTDTILNREAGTLDPTQITRDALMTGFKQDAELLANNTGSFTREAVVRLQDGIIRGGETLLDEAERMSKVNRTPLALNVAENVEALRAKLANDLRGPKSTMLDIGDPIPNPLTNTHDWPVRYGNYGNKLFSSEELAANFAEQDLKLAPGGYGIGKREGTVGVPTGEKGTTYVKQKGIGFYIERMVPFNEGDSLVKDLMVRDLNKNIVPDAVGTSSASGFEKIRNGLFGWIRGANQTLSKNEMRQRLTATFGQYGLREWAKQEGQALVDIAKGKIRFDEITGEPIPWYRAAPRPITGSLTKEEVKEQFTRTLKFAQDAPDPHNAGEPGYFMKTLKELEDHYLTYYQRPPSYNEANAYFSFVKMVEAERVLMELSEYKFRSRLGVEQHQFFVNGPNGKIGSGFVDGVTRRELPRNAENTLVLGDKAGDERLYRADNIPTKIRERIDQQVNDGQKKVIQLYATGQRPLAGFSKVAGNERVVYVVTDNYETKPLAYNHVNRRAGGHFDFEYDHAVKQPIITHSEGGAAATDKRGSKVESLYEGDRTFGVVDNRAQGRDFARRMNEVVELMDAGRWDAAKAKFIENRLPMEWDDFKAKFMPTKGSDGRTVVKPLYTTKEKFYVVPKGSQIADLPEGKELQLRYGSNWRDGTRSGDLSKQFQVNYNRERAEDRVYSIEDKGSPGRPDYQYQPASLADPISTFDRSFKRMINSTFMDDYKIYTVEHWLREAAPYLKTKESELRSAPFANFITPEWATGLDKVDLMKKSNLLSNRYKARQFIGMPSLFDTTIHQVTQWVADEAWEAVHPLKRGALLVPRWLLPYHAEPVAAIRALAYDFKLGLYAVGQVFTQLNSWTTTVALEPIHGAAGTAASLLHSWAAVIPQHVAALDEKASMLGWRPGEFTEARKELYRSNFLHIGGELSDLDTVFNNHSVIQGTSSFRQGGRSFFNWGEKGARVPAFYTAFRKFRSENPFKQITDADRTELLRQANILTNNMTRASNSALNEGIASLPMQFLNYQYRLAETFLGKEIGETKGERSLARVRLMAAYGAMYGIPSAIGVTGLPLGDKARKYAMDNLGYIPGEHAWSTAIMEGWPSLFLNKATGNVYNIGGKWGTAGMTTISDLLRSDKSWLQLLGGAGFDNMYKFISGFDGWYKAMISFAKQDPADKGFKLTFDDLIKPALQISSVNEFRKGYVGYTTGKWIANNNAPAIDVSRANAIFMAVTGLSPQQQADSWLKGQIRAEEKSMQRDAQKSFEEDMHRADMAARNKDPDAAEVYHRNAFATLHLSGFTYEQQLAAIAQYRKKKGDSIDKSDFDFYLGRGVPQDKVDIRRDTFRRLKQYQQGNQ